MGSNRPDTLYSALVGPRRLGRKVEFGLPDLEGRTRILKIHAKVRLGGMTFLWIIFVYVDFVGNEGLQDILMKKVEEVFSELVQKVPAPCDDCKTHLSDNVPFPIAIMIE